MAWTYIVRAGDTLPYIASRFGITVEDILAVNEAVYPKEIRIGQTITLPKSQCISIVNIQDARYTYSTMMQQLHLLKTKYPFIHIEHIGTSVLGKKIPAIKLGTGQKEIHFNGSFHANEWITTILLMRFIEEVSESYTNNISLRTYDMRHILNECSIWIVPMVNPDGVDLVQSNLHQEHPYYSSLVAWNRGEKDFSSWKANIRGVDLNDQFPAFWDEERMRREVDVPGPRDYTGISPLSECEAQAMFFFTCRHSFRLVIALHSQGKEIYWNYRDYEPEESQIIVKRFEEVSGYKAIKLTDSDAGYKDWFIQQFRRPGFTVEVGEGVNPLPIEQFNEIYNDVLGILLESTLL